MEAKGYCQTMDASAERSLLSAFPAGSAVVAIRSYRPEYQFYPARVCVQTPDGSMTHCVIKTSDRIEALEREARALAAVTEMGLPVPAVLVAPSTVAGPSEIRALMVLSELPGKALPWIALTSLAEADLACRLLIRGVLRLHQLTDQVRRHVIGGGLPHVTLSSELNETVQRAGEWLRVDLFARTVEYLTGHLAACEVPLVFTNGDYNPINFLHEGEDLTGWIDFESARFEDPHIGFAKFLIWEPDEYGWGTGPKAGLVERYLYAQNVSRSEFLPRLMLRSLRHLKDDVSVAGAEHAKDRDHIFRILEDGLLALG
jgi:aminoglycoside phosphotransferase